VFGKLEIRLIKYVRRGTICTTIYAKVRVTYTIYIRVSRDTRRKDWKPFLRFRPKYVNVRDKRVKMTFQNKSVRMDMSASCRRLAAAGRCYLFRVIRSHAMQCFLRRHGERARAHVILRERNNERREKYPFLFFSSELRKNTTRQTIERTRCPLCNSCDERLVYTYAKLYNRFPPSVCRAHTSIGKNDTLSRS